MKAIVGDICYPKSDALIIPANTRGIMSRGRPSKIIKDGLTGISKEAKQFVSNNKIEVGQCFSTTPGRLNKRGLKRIYHAVIKRLQSDFTSIHIVSECLSKTLKVVCQDGMQSVAICGLGIEEGELDKKTVARVTREICDKFDDQIEIKIIDNDVFFINEIKDLLED